MGRYYQTAEPEFVQDIMYRPPWELAKEVLQKEQEDYDVAVSKTGLFRDVDIQFIDTPIERENAERIRQELAQQADAVTQQLEAGTADDWRKAIPSITKMGRDLASRYKTGDISQIENSAAQYAAMNKHLESIKDPATKERAKQAYLDKFNQQARGSYDGVFSYDQTYDKKDLTGEFLAEKKNWDDPDITSAISQWKKDGYINSKTTSTKKLEKLKQAFGDFVKAKGYEPYLQQQEQFGLGQYFDPETKQLMSVDDKRSSLSSMGDYAAQGEYKQVTKSQDAKQDWILQMEKQQAWEREQAALAAKVATEAGPLRDAIVHSSEQIRALNKDYHADIANLATQVPGVKSTGLGGIPTAMDIDRQVKELRKSGKLRPGALKALEQTMKDLHDIRQTYRGNKTVAGYAPFAEAFGVVNAQAAQKSFDAYTADPRKLYPIKGTLTINGETIYDTSITDLLAHPENKKFKLTPDQIAKVQGIARDADDNLKDKDDYNNYYIQESSLPIMTSRHPEDWQYNDYVNEYNIEGVPIKQQVSFKNLGVGMAQSTSNKKSTSSSHSKSTSSTTRTTR